MPACRRAVLPPVHAGLRSRGNSHGTQQRQRANDTRAFPRARRPRSLRMQPRRPLLLLRLNGRGGPVSLCRAAASAGDSRCDGACASLPIDSMTRWTRHQKSDFRPRFPELAFSALRHSLYASKCTLHSGAFRLYPFSSMHCAATSSICRTRTRHVDTSVHSTHRRFRGMHCGSERAMQNLDGSLAEFLAISGLQFRVAFLRPLYSTRGFCPLGDDFLRVRHLDCGCAPDCTSRSE